MNMRSVKTIAVTVVMPFCMSGTLIAADIPVEVIDDMTRRGVKCDIYKFGSDPNQHSLVGSTGENGKGTLTDPGKAGEILKPVNLDYASKGDVICPVATTNPLVIEVHRVKKLSLHAEFLASIGRFAGAAYVYNQLADGQQSKSALKAEAKSFEALGDALGVKPAVVKYEGKTVPSEELVAKIKDLQNSNGLPTDGRINPKTLEAAVEHEARSK
jgi:hypothetical protein